MTTPYIGITGFKYPHQIRQISDALWPQKETLDQLQYKVMVGITSSDKRLQDSTSEGKTSPKIGKISQLCKIASETDFLLPMIHYFSSSSDNLLSEVALVFSQSEYGSLYESGLCRAVQLNASWPSISDLQTLKGQLPELKIVLQLPASTLTVSDDEIVTQAQGYVGLVDYFLIDPSGGQGQELDLSRAVVLLNALHESLPACSIGAAGGFGPDNIFDSILTLGAGSYKNFCVDAQGKLRSDDQLDHRKASSYAKKAVSAFSRLLS